MLQRSLARGRLGHAYLFTGHQLEELETLARTLAKTLNCQQPVKTGGVATDCCDECLSCRKIDNETHADIHWARPESKSRVITVDQTRELMREIQLKPTEAEYKVAIIVGADRLNAQAANAFLKTLEEPPAKSVLILLSTEPQRILETILSRCLRLNFSAEAARRIDAAQAEWLAQFGALAAGEQKSLLGRYRLLDVLLQKLGEIRARVEETLTARSPLGTIRRGGKGSARKMGGRTGRRHRGGIPPPARGFAVARAMVAARRLAAHAWRSGGNLLNFPQIAGAETVAKKITPRQALENLQTWSRPSGCSTPTCRKRSRWKWAC